MKRWLKMIRFIACLCLLTLIGVAYVSYICRNSTCNLAQETFRLRAPLMAAVHHHIHQQQDLNLKIESVSFDETRLGGFDMYGSDVIVFLHIQKTGGTTFGRHLVKDLNLEEPCICPRKRKRCDCFRPDTENEQWLFSRYSTGWKCGLHADWTELTDRVEDALDEYEEISKRRLLNLLIYFYDHD